VWAEIIAAFGNPGCPGEWGRYREDPTFLKEYVVPTYIYFSEE
jgi:hypothetical protein